MPTPIASRRHKLLIGALLGGIIGVISAQASFAQGTPKAEPAPQVRYEKETRLDFSEVHLEGELIKPAYERVVLTTKRKFRNLIEMRASFAPELERSQPKL